MAAKHIINRAEFDVRFDDSSSADTERNDLPDLIKSALLPVVEEVFDELGSGGETIRIDTLELDLGEFSRSEYRSEMRHRLREDLRRSLIERLALAKLKPSNESGTSNLSRAESALDGLAFFLRSGRLPWHMGKLTVAEFNAFISRCVAEDVQGVVAVLKDVAAEPRDRALPQFKRLINQFPVSVRKTLFHVLLGGGRGQRYDQADLLFDVIEQALRGRAAGSAWREAAWATLMNCALQSGFSYQNGDRWLEAVLKEVAAHASISYPSLLRTVAIQRDFAKLPDTLRPLFADSVGKGAAGDGEDVGLYTAALLRAMVSLIQQGDPAAPARHADLSWSRLVAEHGTWFCVLLRRYGARAEVRRRVAYGFHEEMLHDVVRLLEPTESEFVIAVSSRPQLFHRLDEPPEQGVSRLKRQLWSFTLGYLLVERGSVFNRRSYLISVLSQLAAHENVSLQELSSTFAQVVGQVEIPSKMRDELLLLISGLTDGDGANVAVAANARSETGSEEMELEAELLSALMAGNERRLGSLLTRIGKRRRYRRVSSKLIDIARSYIGRPDASRHLVKSYSFATLTGLVTLLSPTLAPFIERVLRQQRRLHSVLAAGQNGASGSVGTVWMQITLEYLVTTPIERQSRDTYLVSLIKAAAPFYHVSVLEFVAEFKQVFAGLGQAASMERNLNAALESIEQSGVEIKAPLESDLSENAEAGGETQQAKAERIEAAFLAALEDIDRTSFNRFWRHWYPLEPYLLRDNLLRRGRQLRVRRRISAKASVPVMVELVSLLEPSHKEFIINTVEELAPRRKSIEHGNISGTGFERCLWEFTLSYLLLDSSSRFNRKAYISRLIFQIAAHYNQSEHSLLSTLHSLFSSVTVRNQASAELITLLGELVAERSVHDEDKREIENKSRLQAHTRYAHLADLSCAPIRAHEEFVETLTALFNQSPPLLLRWFRDFQHGRLPTRHLLGLEAELLEKVIELWFAMTGGSSQSLLLDVIKKNSGRARSVQGYYAEVVKQLLAGRVIDFEQIMAKDNVAGTVELEVEKSAHVQSAGARVTSAAMNHDSAKRQFLKLLHGENSRFDEDDAQALDWLLHNVPDQLRRRLRAELVRPQYVSRLAELVPELYLLRLLKLLSPAWFAQILEIKTLLVSAAQALNYTAPLPLAAWEYIFSYLYVEGQVFDEAVFGRGFVEFLGRQLPRERQSGWPGLLCRQLSADMAATDPGLVKRLISAVADQAADIQNPFAEAAMPSSQAQQQEPPVEIVEEEEIGADEQIYVENAGMVLASPYLPRLFSMLALIEGREFVSAEAAERAVHLLQYMVDCRGDAPEYLLVLNKLLCGVKSGTPITAAIEVSDKERETIEGLIQGMVQNWTALGNTSVEGFRHSFLERPGTLQRRDDEWHLLVEPRGYDVLLDKLPWSFNTIRHPWMSGVIHVEWR